MDLSAMTLTSLLFYTLAGLTGLCALAVVVTQHIVRAATWLLFTLAGTAGIFFLLGADFVGSSQLLVYVGGTLVLVVFGVMLTAQGPFVNLKISAAEWFIAVATGLLLYSVLALSLLTVQIPPRNTKTPAVEAGPIPTSILGEALLGFDQATPPADMTGIPSGTRRRQPVSYLLAFEIVSVHLLVVLIAAAYLARAKRRKGAAA
jgi:NADH-quinone oxidoreductase subunit J